jgi:hypothetical protein
MSPPRDRRWKKARVDKPSATPSSNAASSSNGNCFLSPFNPSLFLLYNISWREQGENWKSEWDLNSGCLLILFFSTALPFETGAESEQRVSCAARHSLLKEWWRIFRLQYSTLPMDGPVLVDSLFSKALPFETGAESEQRVSCAARHSLLKEWWRIFLF